MYIKQILADNHVFHQEITTVNYYSNLIDSDLKSKSTATVQWHAKTKMAVNKDSHT